MFVASRIHRSVIARAFCLGCSLFLLTTPAAAQTIDISEFGVGEQISAAIDKMLSQAAAVTPSLIRIEDKTSSVTVTVTNPSTDTLDIELSVSTLAPLTALAGATADGKLGKGLLANVGSSAPAKVDTNETRRSMAAWVKDLPPRLRLAPGEKRSLTLKLAVPAELEPGEYSAWIVATTKFDGVETSVKSQGGGGRAGSFRFGFGGKKGKTQHTSSDPDTHGKKDRENPQGSPDEGFKMPKGAKLIYVAK